MIIKILKEKFIESLEKVVRIATKKTTLPILSFCLIEAEKNFLKIYATNLENAVVCKILAKTEGTGKICLDPKFVLNLVSHIREDTLEMEIENNFLILKTKNQKIKIKGTSPEEFPVIPQRDSLEKISLDCKTFCNSLDELVTIPSPSLGRPEISGIFFSFEKDILTLAATDTFRLAEKKIKLKNHISKTYSMIVPQTTCKNITFIFKKEKELNLFISPNQLFIETQTEDLTSPEIFFTSRLIEGEYPNYQEIIPKKFKTKILVEKENFIREIKTASLFSGKINEVKLKILPKEKKVEIFSENPDYGNYRSEIFCEGEGEEISISFNFKFLISGIQMIHEKELIFSLTSEEEPAVLRPKNDPNYFYILMPIKTS